MKRFLKNSLFILFCAFVLLLSVRGNLGNPTSSDLIKPVWKEKGPFEQSNEGGRFALLYSIVEDHSLNFSTDLARLSTPDLGYRNGKYYSLFAPGVSFIAIPGYLLGRLFGAAQIGAFMTITFFALLNVYLLRKIAVYLGANPIAATISSGAFIFASPAFTYASSLYQHHISTSLILLSVYILMKYKSVMSLAAIWFIYAFAFIVDYPNLIMMFPIALFALGKTFLIKKKEQSIEIRFSFLRVLAIASFVIPLFFLVRYNQLANGGPFTLTGTLDRVQSISDTGKPLLGSDQLKEAIRTKKITYVPKSNFFSPFLNRHILNGLYVHFLSPDRGMIFYTPIMLFGIAGAIYSIKKWNNNTAMLLAILAFNIILYSMWDDPHGGWAFGSRYLVPTYAVLSLFMAKLLTKFKNFNVFLIIFFIVLVYSIGVNTLGPLTSSSIPPKAEALALEKQYHQKQPYTYLKDINLLNNGESKSFFYQNFASDHISAWDYYLDLVAFVVIISGFMIVYYKAHPRQRLSKELAYSIYEEHLAHSISFSYRHVKTLKRYFEKHATIIIFILLSVISIADYIFYAHNSLNLAYNDARSHLDIGRRVVENLKPGFAQLGSVWLPLPHLLMALTAWNNFMWHSGLSGGIQSMIAYVATGMIIYLLLRRLGVNMFGRVVGVIIFALNLNILYMQSTAMTELPLIATMMAGVYELIIWHESEKFFNLIKSAFWIMLSTLIRYDGWFLFAFSALLIFYHTIRKHGYKTTEGVIVIFATLGGFGIFLWLLWNLLIFKDPLYFAFGSFSANAQQQLIEKSGDLTTKKNLFYSIETYIYAFVYNSDFITVAASIGGAILFWIDDKITKPVKFACLSLFSPFLFNVVALYFGHSVLYVEGLGGNSWFNVRYGLTMVPTIAIFVGYLLSKMRTRKFAVIGLMVFVSFFAVVNQEVVTIDDARIGLGGKNVTEVSGYLKDHATDKEGFVLLSAAKHDAIIFSSGLPMTRFIHEGTGNYWDLATAHPEQWARWIVLRINDENDITTKLLKNNPAFQRDYNMVREYQFADVYELKEQYVSGLKTKPDLAVNN